MNKYDHVRAEIADSKPTRHRCHWPGCEAVVPPASWGCRKHWYMLPLGIRNKIWAAYRAGQESDRSISKRYVEVAREAQEWIKARML